MFARRLHTFLQQDFAVGILLLIAAAIALVVANSPLSEHYQSLLNMPITLSAGHLELDKTLLHWINDGLMVIFFLLIGLEVKKEVLEGELRTPSQIMLPGIGAIGGMFFPALFYVGFNFSDAIAIKGWAIPAATDIAFAVGILALLGKKAPASLMAFLLALAIIDDLGAIVIIAMFYTENLSTSALGFAALLMGVLVYLNYRGVARLGAYIFVGILLWLCVLKSGIHATLAGVLLAFTIPMNIINRQGLSPLKSLQHLLHSKVNYIILPIFAFANAGIELSPDEFKSMVNPVSLGVVTGLFLGKQLGVFSFCWLTIKLGLAKLPSGANWLQMYGVSILCGIGFTMSLFIASLAFDSAGAERIGILVGSIVSAIAGYTVLLWAHNKGNQPIQKPIEPVTAESLQPAAP